MPPSLRPKEWLVQRIKNTDEQTNHHEASWYGPYNALLSHYFPYEQQFLVKPQPKIRDEEEADISFSSIQAESSFQADSDADDLLEEDSFTADLSMTSTGRLVIRGAGRIFVPDFIVTKGTPFTSHDKILLLVEVKVEEPDSVPEWTRHSVQIQGYMESLSNQMSGEPLTGLLICGTRVKILTMQGPEYEVREDARMHNINSNTVRQLLWKIATDNWPV